MYTPGPSLSFSLAVAVQGSSIVQDAGCTTDTESEMSSDSADIFEDALSTIFDIVQPAEGNHNDAATFDHPNTGPLRCVIPDVSAGQAHKLQAQHLWRASRHAAELIADRQIIDVVDCNCLELGAGTALPAIVAKHLGARTVRQPCARVKLPA